MPAADDNSKFYTRGMAAFIKQNYNDAIAYFSQALDHELYSIVFYKEWPQTAVAL